MDSREAEEKAIELVGLQLQQKELSNKIRTLKAELKEYTDLENLNEFTWTADNGYVEVLTKTKYTLADIPADVKVDSTVAAVDVAEKAFTSKIILSKEGKKMFKEEYPPIMKLMIPKQKKEIRVVT